ncbi:MAG: hypothetical protein AABZ24_05565, partial [Nitrospirota bacterium]
SLATSAQVVFGSCGSEEELGILARSEQGDMVDQWYWYMRAIRWMMKMREAGSTTSVVGALIELHWMSQSQIAHMNANNAELISKPKISS